VRLQGECPIETLQRALMSTQASQQHGAVVMCGRQVRVERNGPFETLQGFPLASDRLKCDTKVRVRAWVLERHTHCLPGVRERFFATSKGCKCRGTSAIPTDKRSIQSKRAIAGLQRLFFTSERVQRLGEIQQNGRPIGFQFQRPGEIRDGIRTTSRLGERYAQQLQEYAAAASRSPLSPHAGGQHDARAPRQRGSPAWLDQLHSRTASLLEHCGNSR